MVLPASQVQYLPSSHPQGISWHEHYSVAHYVNHAEINVATTGGSEVSAAEQSRESMSQHAISEAIKAAPSGARPVGNETYASASMPSVADTSSAHVPGLILDDFARDAPGKGRSAEKRESAKEPGQEHPSKNPDIPKVKTTFVVDLTTDLKSDDGTTKGAQRRQEELKRLVEESKGHPDATIVVQAPEKASQKDPEKPPDQAPAQAQAPTDAAPVLSRYIIHDGVLTPAEKVVSKGMAADVEELLKFASRNAPSEKIGLAIQSHGEGAAGVGGDTGQATLSQLTEAIRSGMKGSGHDRLDVLDFDACSMSSAAVLSAVHSVADHVVASEELETAGKTFDGQNVTAALSGLLKDPGMSAASLSKELVGKGNQGAEPEVRLSRSGDPLKNVGADTLASYDSSKVNPFNQALDELGGVLSKAAQNDQSRKAIVDLIDNTKQLPTDASDPNPYRAGHRDVKDTVSAIKTGSENGTIPDGDGSIGRAAKTVLDSQGKMTEDFKGSPVGGYDKLGGLYTFLPVREVRNGAAAPIQLLIECSGNNDLADKNGIVRELEQLKTEVSEQLSDAAKKQFQPVIDAIPKIKAAQDADAFQSAMRGLKETVKQLPGSAVDKELKDHQLKTEGINGADRWNEFIQTLSKQT